MGFYGGYLFSHLQELKGRFLATAIFVYYDFAWSTYDQDFVESDRKIDSMTEYQRKILGVNETFEFLFTENGKLFSESLKGTKEISINPNLIPLFFKMVASKFYPQKFIA